MTEEGRTEELERIAESADRIADDGYKLFRLNLIVIGVVLSASVFLSQNAPSNVKKSIITSYYTQASIAALLISTIIGFLTYEPARRLSAMWLYDNPRSLVERHASTARLSFNLRYGMLLSLASPVLFGIGVLEGFLPVGVDPLVVWQLFFSLLFVGSLPIFAAVAWRRIRARASRILN